MSVCVSSVLVLVIIMQPGQTAQTASQPVLMEQPAYLDSYQVEDSCQFNLCGPEYSGEFMAGQAPRVGSCSGDCHLLAINLNSNKFHKEFLWSNCASMCADKYPVTKHKQYKARFMCMESCYNSYEAMYPHHNLARYCIKASCPQQREESIHQVDCFTTCSQHVSSRVSTMDWQHWAMALAGHCQNNVEESKALQSHKLICADKQVWTHITTSMGMSKTDTMATHCFSTLCQGDVKCARTCISHVQAVDIKSRPVWMSRSKSPRCLNMERKDEQMKCADKLVEEHREEERKQEEQMQEEKRRKHEKGHEQALLSVQSSAPCLRTSLVKVFVMLIVIAKLGRL